MKFKLEDNVIVREEGSPYNGMMGKVIHIAIKASVYPYLVEFPIGEREAFRERELEFIGLVLDGKVIKKGDKVWVIYLGEVCMGIIQNTAPGMVKLAIPKHSVIGLDMSMATKLGFVRPYTLEGKKQAEERVEVSKK